MSHFTFGQYSPFCHIIWLIIFHLSSRFTFCHISLLSHSSFVSFKFWSDSTNCQILTFFSTYLLSRFMYCHIELSVTYYLLSHFTLWHISAIFTFTFYSHFTFCRALPGPYRLPRGSFFLWVRDVLHPYFAHTFKFLASKTILIWPGCIGTLVFHGKPERKWRRKKTLWNISTFSLRELGTLLWHQL